MDFNEEIPYELTTENIKIPYFNNPDFEKLLMKPINKDIYTDDLNTLYSKQEELLSLYSNLIKSNRNGINENCLIYKKNTYDYILLMKSVKLLSSVIRNKIMKIFLIFSKMIIIIHQIITIIIIKTFLNLKQIIMK